MPGFNNRIVLSFRQLLSMYEFCMLFRMTLIQFSKFMEFTYHWVAILYGTFSCTKCLWVMLWFHQVNIIWYICTTQWNALKNSSTCYNISLDLFHIKYCSILKYIFIYTKLSVTDQSSSWIFPYADHFSIRQPLNIFQPRISVNTYFITFTVLPSSHHYKQSYNHN